MHEGVFEIQRNTLGFHVFEMEDKLRVNLGETLENLVNLGIQCWTCYLLDVGTLE